MFLKEEEMYPYVKTWLEDNGHTVRSEVCKIDIVSEHCGVYHVYEMKLKLTLDLIYQALNRVTTNNLVYIIVPIPEGKIARKNWEKNQSSVFKLCRSIGIGLIVIDRKQVLCLVEAQDVWSMRKSPKKNKRMISEFSRRSGDHNIGGISKKKLITAYQEDCLRCLNTMSTTGLYRPVDIKNHSKVEKTSNILNRNVYKWFVKKEKGVYDISQEGMKALEQYKDIIAVQNTMTT